MSLTVRIFFVTFIVLLIAASASQETLLWGASAWRSVSLTMATVLAAALLLLLIGKIRGGLAVLLELPDRWSKKTAFAATAVLFVLMWLLRSRHFLWGDGYSMGIAIERGAAVLPSAPLATALSRGFFEILNRLLFWNVFDSSALLSVISGFLFAAAVRASLSDSRDRDGSTFPAAAFALTGGYFAVFFGFGGASPLAAAGMGMFIWLAAVRLSGGAVPLVIPVLAATAAIMTEVSNIFLVIPLAYLLVDAARRRESRLEAAAAAGTAAACWIAVELAASRLTGIPGISSHLAGAASRTFSSFTETGAATALSFAFNSLILAGPAALLAVVLAVTRGRKPRQDRNNGTSTFLLVTATSAAIFIFLAATKVRGGLRWDLIVPASAAMSVYAAAELRGRSASPKAFISSAVLITALGLFHIIPVIATDFSLEAGRSRILDLPLPTAKAETVIGAQAWYSKDYEEASEWFAAAAEKDPVNADIWHRHGRSRMKMEDPLEAISSFNRAAELAPENHVYRTDLAEAYIVQRWYVEARIELEALTAEFPDSARLWTRLGYACNHGNMYPAAVDAYTRALELDPDNRDYIRNLTSSVLNRGAELQKEGDFDEARKMYRFARQLYPGDWVSLNNLATLEMELGKWEKARTILAAALKEHIGVSQLHFNMSVVLENLGDYVPALEHLQRAAQLDRFNPPATEHVERLMKKADESRPSK